jgi:aryl-alcohol dehydrogenase-like predicted oxidoreductase
MSTRSTNQPQAAARELGRTGQYVAPLALGAMLMGTRTSEPESRRILDHFTTEVAPRFAVDGAQRPRVMIDTADCYCWWENRGSDGGESEELLGRWLVSSGRRDEVFLATKGTGRVRDTAAMWRPDGPDWALVRGHYVGAARQTLKDSLDASLRRLGVDHVDLYYVHVDDRATPLEETLATLAGFVEEGKVRYLGWSNVRTWRLERIRALCEVNGWPQPVALQQQYTYLRPRTGLGNDSTVEAEQLDYLRERDDLSLVAYSPIAKGVYDPAKRPGHWVLDEIYGGPDTDARFAAVDALADEMGVSGNQLALAWMLHQDDPRVLPLIGPRTWEHYEAALPALDLGLTSEQLRHLDASGA